MAVALLSRPCGWASIISVFFRQRPSVFSRQSVLQLLEGKRSQVISSSTGIRYAFNNRIDTAFRVDVACKRPAGGQQKDRHNLRFGCGSEVLRARMRHASR